MKQRSPQLRCFKNIVCCRAAEHKGWADQLTSYDGEEIRYDASGNPTTYRGYTMTWNGRQLASATNGTNSISYSYEENGIRTQKTVNGVTTNYNYHGSVLISQVTGNDTLLFSYDAAGNVAAVNYNGTYYYLLLCPQWTKRHYPSD